MISSAVDSLDNQLLCDVITRTTAAVHQEVESLPFSMALLDGRLPLQNYVLQLVAYRLIHSSVFEGAANGGIFMCRFLKDAFGFSEHGYRYYFGNGFQTAADWRHCKEIINDTPEPERRLVVAGAWHTFQQISELLQLLEPDTEAV
jgi:heme oxygenase